MENKLLNKKILITGGCGYLGKALVDALFSLGANISIIDKNCTYNKPDVNLLNIDLKDLQILKENVKIINPDIIFHLAAINDRSRSISIANTLIENNLTATINLLESLENISYEQLIYTNTSEIYGDVNTNIPIKETDSFLPASPYSLTKYFAEQSIRTLSKINNKPYLIFRFFNLHGSGMSQDFFIPQLIKSLKSNSSFHMTSGEQVRDFLYIDDAIKALVACCFYKGESDVFNVSSGTGIKIKDLAIHLKKIYNSRSLLNFGTVPYRENEVWNMIGDNNKFVKTFNFKPKSIIEVFNEKKY